MSDRKIMSLNDARKSQGLPHLMEQASQTKPQQKPIEPIPETQCMLMHVPLQGKSYYIPLGRFGAGPVIVDGKPIPMFMVFTDMAYSEVFEPVDPLATLKVRPVISIQRHAGLQVISTGIVNEIVTTPAWWSKRDEGAL